MLIVSVGLVTLGSIMMVNKLFTDELIVWIVASALIVASICCFVMALYRGRCACRFALGD
jgi:hypothetical protein